MSSALIAAGLAVWLAAGSAVACEKSQAVAASVVGRVAILGATPGVHVLTGCDVGPALTPEEKRVVEWAVEEFVRRLADPQASLDLTDEDITAGTGLDPDRLDRDRLHAATTAALVARLSGTSGS
jgi:hypothetical protein